jgi:xylulokinase
VFSFVYLVTVKPFTGMLLLGIDLGTSSTKVSVVDPATGNCIASARYPDMEAAILAIHPGWAEQEPDTWWKQVQQAILKCHATGLYDPKEIGAIGIAYQMHGLVLTDKRQQVLRNSIIWCDSRAVTIGEKAFEKIGRERCFRKLLNSPGNFTASKLAWVKEHEPDLYARADKIMLPGDFIAMKFTGEITTTVSALSEGVFWDFESGTLSEDICSCFGFENYLFPAVRPVFSTHGFVDDHLAEALGLRKEIPVSYKAGDQLNNALALNVLHPGEVAATAGTSGVVYAVSEELIYDKESRVNSFAHVNHDAGKNSIGVLLCINGCGIANRWIRNIAGGSLSYQQMNEAAAGIPAGSDGLQVIPFGNGAERILGSKMTGAGFMHLDYNIHTPAHLFRATQEGVAFAFRLGIDSMRENGIAPAVMRAGQTNLFLSGVFTEALVNSTGIPVELYEGDGSVGAAIGAGIGAGIFSSVAAAFTKQKPLRKIVPVKTNAYHDLYERWKETLLNTITKKNELCQF